MAFRTAAPQGSEPLSVEQLCRRLHAERRTYLAFLRHRLGSPADAEDVLQQAMARAVERSSTLRQPEQLSAWFYAILRNAVADHHASATSLAALLEAFGAQKQHGDAPEAAPCVCAVRLLSSLKPEHAALVKLVDIDDRAISEAAQALAISSNNAAVRLHRARKTIRDGLTKCCGMTSFREAFDCDCDGGALG